MGVRRQSRGSQRCPGTPRLGALRSSTHHSLLLCPLPRDWLLSASAAPATLALASPDPSLLLSFFSRPLPPAFSALDPSCESVVPLGNHTSLLGLSSQQPGGERSCFNQTQHTSSPFRDGKWDCDLLCTSVKGKRSCYLAQKTELSHLSGDPGLGALLCVLSLFLSSHWDRKAVKERSHL